MFKENCTNFLNSIMASRSTAITKAVNEAISREHTPYENEVISVRDAFILEEQNKTAELIKALQADLERKVNEIKNETSKAINEHRERIVSAATAKAKADYDSFILDFSKLVDNTNIE